MMGNVKFALSAGDKRDLDKLPSPGSQQTVGRNSRHGIWPGLGVTKERSACATLPNATRLVGS